MENKEKQEGQFQLELPQNVAQGEYANFALITHSFRVYRRLRTRVARTAKGCYQQSRNSCSRACKASAYGSSGECCQV